MSSRSNPHTTEPIVPLPADLDCQTTDCSLQYSELCLICNIAFCHNHFLTHPCQQSTSAGANPDVMDWSYTLPESVSKTYNSYNVSQKQIAIFAASKYGIEAVSSTFGFHRSLIWRWKQKISYVPNADDTFPPADLVPARPVQELCGLRPEERNFEENRLVFQRLGEDPDACLPSTEILNAVSHPDLVDQFDAADDNDDDDEVQQWKDALNQVATEDNQLEHQYSSQSLKIALESGMPDDVKHQVEKCMNDALEHNNHYRSQRTSTAWKPKQRSFLVSSPLITCKKSNHIN
jgi:hypothetical protein